MDGELEKAPDVTVEKVALAIGQGADVLAIFAPHTESQATTFGAGGGNSISSSLSLMSNAAFQSLSSS